MDLRSFNVALLFFHWCLWKVYIWKEREKKKKRCVLMNFIIRILLGYEILSSILLLQLLTNYY